MAPIDLFSYEFSYWEVQGSGVSSFAILAIFNTFELGLNRLNSLIKSSLIRAHTPSPKSVLLGTTTAARDGKKPDFDALRNFRIMSWRNSNAVSAVFLSSGKLPLSKRNKDRKLRRLISFTMEAFLKLDLICYYENKGIADLIDELLSQKWESEEKEIMESIDTKLAKLRCSNVFRKLAKVKEPKTKQRTHGIKNLMFED